MNKEWICEMASRALIGDFRNMTHDCIENLRPRAQYMHFYRGSIKKLRDLFDNWCIQDLSKKLVLQEIYEYLCSHPKVNHDNQIETSKNIMGILIRYGYDEPTTNKREIDYR